MSFPDQEGVGKLVEMAVKLGRQARPELEIGICGEPSSVEFCYRAVVFWGWILAKASKARFLFGVR